MYQYVSLFWLMLFLYSPGSSSTPSPSSNSNNHEPTGCYGRPNLGMSFLRDAFITFHNHEERDFQFAIKTSYHIYYPKAIRSALQLDKFELHALKGDQECGWQKATSVHSAKWTQIGIHRGDIY